MNNEKQFDAESDHPVDHALRYARAGLSVVAVACDGTKQPPLGQTWKHLQSKIAREPEIRRMFAGKKGIGIICGRVSGNLETLDIDCAGLVEPFESAVRELSPGLLERLSTVATPRNDWGGRHYRYRIAGAVAGNTKLAQSELRLQFNGDGTPEIDDRTGERRFAPETLIETRGEGGYAIAPGSPAECHETGLPYKLLDGPTLESIPLITAEEHEVLWQVAKSFNRYVDQREVTDCPAAARTGDSPGDAFNASVSWKEILVPARWTVDRVTGELTHWRRPGKSRGTSATTGVRSSAGTELLCVFSTNAYPLEGPTNGRVCSSYSKFAAFTILNHAGDYSAAAKELRSRGFGSSAGIDRRAQLLRPPVILPEPFRPFPTRSLPPLCSLFVQQAATSIGCDESMIALPLIGAIASAIGNSCRISLKPDYSEPSVIWAAVVCESGSRKSPAIECPLRPLRKKEGESFKNFRGALRGYGIDMATYRASLKSNRSKKDHGDSNAIPEAPQLPTCRRYTVSDVTSEAVAVRLEQNPRGLLLVRDELAGFFNCMNQYKSGGKGGDEAAYLAMHGARSLVIDRKSPEKPQIYVPLAALSIVGAIQPDILRRILTRERMESGMAARFLLAYPSPRTAPWTEQAIDKAVDDRLAAMFDWLVGLELKFDPQTNEPIPALLPLTAEAKELWIAFHDDHAGEQAELHGDLSAAWAKLTGYAARLSLVCELASWASGNDFEPPTVVTAASVEAGITLARWFSAETKRIYAILDESDEQRDLRELVEYILRQGGVVTARQLTRGPRRYRNNAALAEADLQRLVQWNQGEWINLPSGEHGGRPTRTFCLIGSLAGDETSLKFGGNGGSVAVATMHVSRNPKEGEE
jgi:hypothetical protein